MRRVSEKRLLRHVANAVCVISRRHIFQFRKWHTGRIRDGIIQLLGDISIVVTFVSCYVEEA